MLSQDDHNSQIKSLELIQHTARVLFPPGVVVELRALDAPGQGTVSGYFDDMDALAQAALQWSGKAPAVYTTLNPCTPSLLARSANRVRGRAKTTTTDSDIATRRWLPLDFDPVRPAGISSTDAEHTAALERAEACTAWLTDRGWPRPCAADSGNGGHLLYAIDVPNDEDSRRLMQRCLEALAFHFSDDAVALDTSVFNAARIWKVYGTMACKGDHLPERPHRLSRLLSVPEPLERVTRTQLEDLAALLPAPPETRAPGKESAAAPFDLTAWITAHALSIASQGPWKKTGRKWVLNPCPWNDAHTNGAAYIVRHEGGAIAAGCHHNGCQGNDWHALRDLVEPGWRGGRREQPETINHVLTTENHDPATPCEIRPQPLTTLTTLTTYYPWPTLAPEALYGLAGDYVKAIAPHTESDPVALLTQFKAVFGVLIGRQRYCVLDGVRHYPNIFAVIAGLTARARKGTSYRHVERQVQEVDPTWGLANHIKGCGSGEGLIYAVRDARWGKEAIKEKGRVVDYQDVLIDAGVEDKRALYQTGEFSGLLKVAAREGNTLSEVLRDCWDTGYLRNATKAQPLEARGAHISVIGHITIDELQKLLTSTDMANGFGNRFLWVCARRSQLLPRGGQLASVDFTTLRERLRGAIAFGKAPGEMYLDRQAWPAWDAVYGMLSEDRTGLANTLLARAEPQVMRLSMLYAILDQSTAIQLPHLKAALALWEYTEDSATYIFGQALGDTTADTILQALEKAGSAGLSQNDIVQDVFHRNLSAAEVTRALHLLEKLGSIVTERRQPSGGKGRPSTLYTLRPYVVNVVDVVSPGRYLTASNNAVKEAGDLGESSPDKYVVNPQSDPETLSEPPFVPDMTAVPDDGIPFTIPEKGYNNAAEVPMREPGEEDDDEEGDFE